MIKEQILTDKLDDDIIRIVKTPARISEIARTTGRDFNTVRYRVHDLERHGILTITKVNQRTVLVSIRDDDV
jgi:predicted transcriptional regulator